jgi:hypothetical protein
LVAAPLDNYWHELYGIDIALWAPFHMMGVTGAFIGSLGIVYIFASEIAIDRHEGIQPRTFLGFSFLEWGALMTIAGLLNLTLIGFLQFPIIFLGLLQIPTYFLPAAACGAFCLVSSVLLTSKPGSATLMVILLFVFTIATSLFVPWAIHTAVEQQGLHYRTMGPIPYFQWNDALLPLAFTISAFIIDGIVLWRIRHGKPLNDKRGIKSTIGLLLTVPELIIAPCVIMWNLNLVQAFLDEPGVIIPLDLKLQATLLAVPIVLFAGQLGAVWGTYFGDIWRLSRV